MDKPGRPPFRHLMPTHVIYGAGQLSMLSSLIEEVGGPDAKVLLVTGQRSLQGQGILDDILKSLAAHRVSHWDQIHPNPPPEVVEEAVALCRNQRCQVVVGIGGGSVLDAAKFVATLSPQSDTPRAYFTKEAQISRPGLPFVAVPTTSGSSSEVTPFSTVWDMEEKRRYVLSHPLLFPTVALVDPVLTLTMPRSLTAITAMDAFASAFECYWSINSQPVSDALALNVIQLFIQNLERSCLQADLDSRSACALAATMSGMAYSQTGTTICHTLSYPLTMYFDVPHGLAVGITLASFLRRNAQTIQSKMQPLLAALDVNTLEEGAQRIIHLMERCGLPTKLRELGVTTKDLDLIAANGLNLSEGSNNPLPIQHQEVKAILTSLL